MQLFQKLQEQVTQWRENNYESTKYLELREILTYNKLEDGSLRFLRQSQFETIETYLYLRYILNTPHTIDLYKELFQDEKIELCRALGITHISNDAIYDVDIHSVLERIKHNDRDIVKTYKYQTLQEALQLDYASYILALVMGAGKTILIAAIIGIEFAIALNREEEEQQQQDIKYMKNALVFAKGTTIIESLREISTMDFSKIIPPRLYKKLAPNLKINYTTQNDKEFDGVIARSSYNILITNTEKIMLKKKSSGSFFNQTEEEKTLQANSRLNKITSLPNLAIFSDEAHNTYGQTLEKDLKRVRETINHIHKNKELVCVINTTGTPYFKKQALKEVVYWYSLEQGIKDNILKSVENNIVSYDFTNGSEESIIKEVVQDFFSHYGDVSLQTGQQSKIAFYFKTIEHLTKSKETIEHTLNKLSLSPSIILVNTGESSTNEIQEFNSLNNPDSQKRIILLVAKGVEGWNCPSLFATALIKEQTSSNNFVLQASSRCLRQVVDNTHLAKIYLSSKNVKIFDNELQNTYNTSVIDLKMQSQESAHEIHSIIRKTDIPKLIIKKKIKRIVRKKKIEVDTLKLDIPQVQEAKTFRYIYRLEDGQLKESNMGSEVKTSVEYSGIYNVGVILSSNYHLHYLNVINILKKYYPSCTIPKHHITALSEQIEKQINDYEEIEDIITQALAVIKLQDEQGNYNFSKNKDGYFYHTIRYKENSLRERLLVRHQDYPNNPNDLGFHFDIYDFDSNPEKDFFNKLFNVLTINQNDIKDIYFTGSITDKNKTDFYFEYQNEDGVYAPYYPDFLIRKKDESFLIVEIKAARDRNLPEVLAKEKAIKTITVDNSDVFQYIIISTANENIEDNNSDWGNVGDWIAK